MTGYIIKRATFYLLLVLIIGFVLYMLGMSTYRFEDGLYRRSWRVQWGGTDYFYRPDWESSCFSPLYILPVKAEYAVPSFPDAVIEPMLITFTDTSPKFYASPFSKERIVLRSGFSQMLFTLYHTETAVTP